MRSTLQIPELYDKWLIFSIIAIIIMGLTMMTSASIVVSENNIHQPFYFLFKQLIFLTIGILIGGLILQINLTMIEKWSGYLLMAVIALLALVLIPGIGHRVNGSARWIGYGPLSFQISELAKLIVVIYMAGYLVRRNLEIRTQWTGFFKPLLILATIGFLLLREPDFGATVVVITTALGMMFLAGMRLRYFLMLFLVVIGSLSIIAISAPYRLARLTTFLNPWAKPFDAGYQLTQSLIAFGRGGWFGVGLGNSVQKMFYLPESYTDFLFAIIAEELGLIGVVFIISIFLILIVRIFYIARRAQCLNLHYGAFLAYGFGLWIAIQFTVSVGVNSGLLPTKGLTLPFMSYGGSSVLVNCILIAILLRIDYENRFQSLASRHLINTHAIVYE